MLAKKIVVILLTIMFLILTTNALAANDMISARYSAIEDFYVNLSVQSDKMVCKASLRPSSSSSTAGLTATLKRSINGQTWTNVASWSASGSNTSRASINKTVSVSRGYQYKLFVTGKIYSASGALLETAYKNSSIVAY